MAPALTMILPLLVMPTAAAVVNVPAAMCRMVPVPMTSEPLVMFALPVNWRVPLLTEIVPAVLLRVVFWPKDVMPAPPLLVKVPLLLMVRALAVQQPLSKKPKSPAMSKVPVLSITDVIKLPMEIEPPA